MVAMAATETGVVYEGVFGSRRIHEGPVMTRDTIFRVASMVKLITSVAALRLVEQGKLSLEAPVPDIDPVIAAAAGARWLRSGRQTTVAAGQAADFAP